MTARVLVVDDVDANVKLLEVRLTAEYFEVRTARSGPEALHICAQERADVVLLDIMMPGMDGFEVCRRLKAEPRTQHIPVIMVTALDQPSDRVKGLEAGADDFLTKPVDDIALITRVKNVARLKMLTDEMLMRASTEEQMGFTTTLGAGWISSGAAGASFWSKTATVRLSASWTRSRKSTTSSARPIRPALCCGCPTAISIS
jgi:two-component system cell cycle response regulator